MFNLLEMGDDFSKYSYVIWIFITLAFKILMAMENLDCIYIGMTYTIEMIVNLALHRDLSYTYIAIIKS